MFVEGPENIAEPNIAAPKVDWLPFLSSDRCFELGAKRKYPDNFPMINESQNVITRKTPISKIP